MTAVRNMILLVCELITLASVAFSQAPVVLFTDLDSGPNSGGENGNGTILSIYGKHFGSSGTVTIGGVQPVKVFTTPAWGTSLPGGVGLQKISVQLGSGISGSNLPVVVTVNGVASNSDVTFTVRSGNIYCVSPTGSDRNNGQFTTNPVSKSGTKGCWATWIKSTDTMVAGDITYFLNGFTYTGGYTPCGQFAVDVCNLGTRGKPFAFVGYPGATVTMGSLTSGSAGGIGTYGDWITIANMNAWTSGRGSALHMSNERNNEGGQGIRLIDIDVQCPNGDTQDGCFDPGSGISGASMSGTSSSWDKVYGVRIHNVSTNISTPTKFWHAVYVGDGTRYIDIGWSAVYNSNGNRGIQIYTSSSRIVGIKIHDSLIHDIAGMCLMIGSMDVSAPTQFYNNIIYNCGLGTTGGMFVEGASPWDCVQAGATPSGNGTIDFFSNTVYNCASKDPTNGAALDLNSTTTIRFYNNIIDVLSGQRYTINDDLSILSGSNNLWFGARNGPSQTTRNINTDPRLVNPGTDFHLQSSSPAIGAGTATLVPMRDFDGVLRPNPPAIGAYELSSGVQRPNPPTNWRVTVQ